jgi:hypothetical protein
MAGLREDFLDTEIAAKYGVERITLSRKHFRKYRRINQMLYIDT